MTDDSYIHRNTDSDIPSIVLPDMRLHGARWDGHTAQLVPLSDDDDTRATRCRLLLTLKQTVAHSAEICATYDCPVLLVISSSVRETTLQSSTTLRLCTVPLPCSANWEQQMRTNEPHTQGDTSTSLEQKRTGDCSLAVFLGCEWPL